MSNRSRKVSGMGRRRRGDADADAAPIHSHRPRNYRGQHIVRTPGIGICRLGPVIYGKWLARGGAQGPLGLPVLDEQPMPDGRGRFALFEWGGIYVAPNCGVHAVHGVLFDRWLLAGGAPDLFGYPCTDVLPTAGGRGCYCHFEWGTIYSPDGVAICAVLEPVRSTWLLIDGPVWAASLVPMHGRDTDQHGFGHWLLNNGAHCDPGRHALYGQTACVGQILPQ